VSAAHDRELADVLVLDRRRRKRSRDPLPWPAKSQPALTRHPSFRRVVRAVNPVWSGLSRRELEQHVAGVLAVVDAADNRKRGLV
jgi:hypothetical protein